MFILKTEAYKKTSRAGSRQVQTGILLQIPPVVEITG